MVSRTIHTWAEKYITGATKLDCNTPAGFDDIAVLTNPVIRSKPYRV